MYEIAPATFEIPREAGMLVPGLLIATQKILAEMEIERPLEQVKNVAHLPGIVGSSIAMPDIHWGYGFPIGGVAATDAEEGAISPGGVGYDINCGVRLALVPLSLKELSPAKKKELIDKIYALVPSGVGRGHQGKKRLSAADYRELIQKGAAWSIEQGFGYKEDLDHCESHGLIEGALLDYVSKEAQERGEDQLGTIGSGNHFIEVGEIEKIFLPAVASKWGIEGTMTYILIHSGSRGFGHQICQDTLNTFVRLKYHEGLPDKQLVAAPIKSKEGQAYLASMAAAANFAFNNRQRILHYVREAFYAVCGIPRQDIRLLYDVCHNIAKFETHEIKGRKRRVCVHRKGATRAYGPGAPELAPMFQDTGQPVLVPGDMKRASFLLVGAGNPRTFCSCCHGAGRVLSRVQSLKASANKNLIQELENEGVLVRATSTKTIAEEIPEAYKDVDSVVEAVEKAHLAQRVARLRPHLVLKG